MSNTEIKEMTVHRLTPDQEHGWEQLVVDSPASHLMARCGFFRYHADRFDDHSLIFRRDNRPMAVLPANRVGDTLWSHQGVSFGGLVMSKRCRFGDVRDVFSALQTGMREDGFSRLLYRPAPHPYQRLPREDDLYCLKSLGAVIVDTKLHSMVRCVSMEEDAATKSWRQDVRYAIKAGAQVTPGGSIPEFWSHVEALLRERHGQKPIHSLDDILLLAERFPKEIRLLRAVGDDGRFLAGQLYTVWGRTLTCMYIGETSEGRGIGASRLLMDHLIHAPEYRGHWLDLGQWTDTDTREESESLLYFKESSGARLIQRNTWELTLT